MSSIRKTRHGTHMVMWRDPEGRQKSKSFKRRVHAAQFQTRLDNALLGGTYVDPALGKTRFEPWIRQWQSGRLNLKPSTRDRDQSLVENHLLPRFGQTPLAAIKPSDVREWVADLASRRSPATTRKAYQLLAASMDQAAADGLIPRSPCHRIELPRLEPRSPRFLTVDQVLALVEAVPSGFTAMVLTAAMTGLRFGELASLRIQELDLERSHLRVVRTQTRNRGKIEVGAPKTAASRRSVSLPRDLVPQLQQHLQDYPNSLGLVFASEQGEMINPTNFRRRVWVPTVNSVGLPGVRFHDLRHTHASLLIHAGEDPKVISERLGHTSVRTTLDVYGHLYEGRDAEAASRLNEAFQRR